MTCKDFEQDIYLYFELSETERTRVDKHTQECAACKELLELISSTQTLVEKVSTIKPEPVNHARLTSNIMQAVQKKESNYGNSLLNSLFLKYSMVAISFALIITFAIEQTSSSGVTPTQQTLHSGMVTLNSVSIVKSFQKRKEKNQLHITSLYACVKSEDCSKSLIENFRKKAL